ncbi:MAG: hypothetical protein J6Z08_08225 [Elusimicrobiales bacterium]|nr:hypothetical protein [Elusimicrobiales bacterium]
MTKSGSGIIRAGSWPPGSDRKKNPLEWIILEKNGDSDMLLLCTEAVSVMPYHNSYAFISWEKSDIRQWLNGVFFEKAFSREEKKNIITSAVKYDSYMASGSISEGLSADRCFLLSREEAYRYFENDIQRQLRSSVADNKNGNAHSWWWLRSVGYYVNSASVVYADGGISSCGVHIGLSGGVRPAVRMCL